MCTTAGSRSRLSSHAKSILIVVYSKSSTVLQAGWGSSSVLLLSMSYRAIEQTSTISATGENKQQKSQDNSATAGFYSCIDSVPVFRCVQVKEYHVRQGAAACDPLQEVASCSTVSRTMHYEDGVAVRTNLVEILSHQGKSLLLFSPRCRILGIQKLNVQDVRDRNSPRWRRGMSSNKAPRKLTDGCAVGRLHGHFKNSGATPTYQADATPNQQPCHSRKSAMNLHRRYNVRRSLYLRSIPYTLKAAISVCLPGPEPIVRERGMPIA